jgi:pimeloyl-ACP methyl ester carboxylesterase
LRSAIVLAIAMSAVLGAATLISKLGGNEQIGRTFLSGLRYLVAAEFAIIVIAALIGFNYERRARSQEAALLRPPGQLIDVGGYRLHLYCAGSGGPTIILEHGHRATYLDWFRVQPQIAEFTRVCSFDRAGYGWSDDSPRRRVPSVMAEELHSLLIAGGEKPPYVLVAHSFGGLNALMFAHKYPNEVAGLVLVDSAQPETLRQISGREKLWLRTMEITMPFGVPRWRHWCGEGPPEVANQKIALTCRSRFFQTIRREDAAFPRSVDEMKAITSLGDLPLVVIARDPALGKNAAAEARNYQLQRKTTELSKNSRFMVAEGSAHDVPLARPDVIVSAVRGMLRPREQVGSRGTP